MQILFNFFIVVNDAAATQYYMFVPADIYTFEQGLSLWSQTYDYFLLECLNLKVFGLL